MKLKKTAGSFGGKGRRLDGEEKKTGGILRGVFGGVFALF
jgi:hypothetical protein